MGPLPTVVLVGAMKAGTTSLFVDLVRHPDICGSIDKEPEVLLKTDDRDEFRARYGRQFIRARSGQERLEASTGYTKFGFSESVAGRANGVLPERARIIYQVRDPVARTVSHARHLHRYGQTQAGSVAEILHEHPEVIGTSRYHEQLSPWLDAFPGRVRVLFFEDYTGHRAETLQGIVDWLGVPARDPSWIGPEKPRNQSSEEMGLRSGPLAAIRNSRLYQRIRPWLGHDLRASLGQAFSYREPPPRIQASEADLSKIHAALESDIGRFLQLPEVPPCPWEDGWSDVS